MDFFILNRTNSVANEFLRQLRDKNLQNDRLRFRRNLERLGAIMAYEISKKLTYNTTKIETPLASQSIHVLSSKPVLITVLRAGLPYFQGFLDFFDDVDCGFIGAYRKEGENEITINLEYLATPSLEGKEMILIDPMLATGNSFIRAIQALEKKGKPSHWHLAALVAAPEGAKHIEKTVKVPFTLWTGALDEKLNDLFYIVPGLGDAGDLSFGEKI